jgi:predicted metal-dependent phosphoesterase TrpH
VNKSKDKCDLHVHSSYSDGEYSPAALVRMARDSSLAALAVTDHDTIEGQQEAQDAGKSYRLEVISGVEFSVRIEDREIHILGYLIDYNNSDMIEEFRLLRLSREDRARNIIDKLSRLGIDIPYREIEQIAGEGTVGRPHIARALLERGVVSSHQEAFNRFIGYNGRAFVPKNVLTMDRVADLIIGAGGVAVWAHPARMIFDRKLRKKLMDSGIRGVEVWHPNHNREYIQAIMEFSKKNNLIATGGSDFHSDQAMKVKVGEITVSYDAVNALKREQAKLKG